MERIAIIGSSSSGKTTLANKLSRKLVIQHKELDYFFWEPNWVQADNETFRFRVDKFTSQQKWITDGNFSQVRDLVWGRATTIIWLDYSFVLIMKQFFSRSIRRSLTKESLWSGNIETLWNSILKPDSLFVWILKTYKRNIRRYSKLMKDSEYSHAEFIRLKSPKETQQFLNSLKIKV